MKAITLTQPWATLVAIGAKRIETRSWGTKYRGPLAIHAAKTFPDFAQALCRTEPFHSILGEHTQIRIVWSQGTKHSDFPLGAVIATCQLVRCWKIGKDEAIPEPERSFGDYTAGRYAWLLANVHPLPEPVPARGALGLWEWGDP